MTHLRRLSAVPLGLVIALGCTSPTGDPALGGDASGPAGDARAAGFGDAPGAGSDGAGSGGSDAPPVGAMPPGPDTTTPYPIDTGDDGAATPGTYKGLWQRLTDNGEPSVTAVDGVIGVVCIGMSNSTQECADYVSKIARTYGPELNPQVKVVDCAVGGNAIEKWNEPANDRNLWDACVDTKLPAAGVRVDQVRVVYHKAADMFTTSSPGAVYPPYPDAESDFYNFKENLSTFAGRVKTKLPAVQAVYTSSRSYGGFSTKPERGEPLSYEEGHALNQWLAEHPTVDGVWYGWGPYLWAPECATGATNGSDVCYVRADYQGDGIHPATGAKDKISAMIHARMLGEAWYAR